MPPFVLVALLSGLWGGNNELLNYIPADTYWEAKHVKVSGETMLAELKSPATAPTKELPKAAAVRKLMAIRALGELKHKDALPVLEALLKSDEMFVADYARAAILAMGGKVVAQPAPELVDAIYLPADLTAVGSVRLKASGKAFDPAPVMKLLANVAPPDHKDDAAKVLAPWVNQAIELAEKIGNVRLDAMTAGVRELAPGDKTEQYVATIYAGQYDHAALSAYLDRFKFQSKKAGALSFLDLDPEFHAFALACVSDRYLLTLSGDYEGFPRDAMAEAFKQGKGKLPENKSLWAMIGPVSSRDLWAVIKEPGEKWRTAGLEAFDVLTVEGTFRSAGGLDVKIAGKGKDPKTIAAAVDELSTKLKQARDQLKETPAEGSKPFLDVIDSIKCSAVKESAQLTAAIPQFDLATIFALYFVSVRDMGEPPAPQPEPPPTPLKPIN